MRKPALHWQILIAIGLAVIVGLLVKSGTTDEFAPNIFGVPFVSIFDYIGTLFLNALKMIIVPLITSGFCDRARPTITSLLEEPLLVKYGFVNGQTLREAYQLCCAGKRPLPPLNYAIGLEVWLRRMSGEEAP